MTYTIKRLQERFEDGTLVSVSFAVSVQENGRGFTRECTVSDLAAYQANPAAAIKEAAVSVLAGADFPAPPPIVEIVPKSVPVAITKKEVSDRRKQIEDARKAEEAARKAEEDARRAEAEAAMAAEAQPKIVAEAEAPPHE